MQEQLRKLMKDEGLNSTRLAELLGIQVSGISHIMSGRNKPSYDFLVKLLRRFPNINPDWLLLDKGPMYREDAKKKNGVNMPDEFLSDGLFSAVSTASSPVSAPMQNLRNEDVESDDRSIIPSEDEDADLRMPGVNGNTLPSVESIIVCYRDKSCKVYKVRN